LPICDQFDHSISVANTIDEGENNKDDAMIGIPQPNLAANSKEESPSADA
jgi:hypothetical protein